MGTAMSLGLLLIVSHQDCPFWAMIKIHESLGKFMKAKYILMALLLSVLSITVQAAGSPMNESFTELIALSNEAIEAGQQGNAQAFIEKINGTLEILKAQDEKGSSIRLQRTSAKLKMALKAAKAGKLQEGIEAVQEGIAIMESEKKP